MEIFKNLKKGYENGSSVHRLIYWNVAVAIVFTILKAFHQPSYSFLLHNFSLNSKVEVFITKPWTILTYSFVHADFIHLLFNMLMLYFISQLFQTFFTQLQLLTVYLFGAVFAGIVYLITGNLFLENTFVVGSSGAIMALLFAVTVYQPNMNVRLMLIGNVKIWHIAAVFVLLDIIQIPINNAGGHITHLGGALFGFIFIQFLNKGFDLTSCLVWIKDLFSPKKKKKNNFKNVYRNTNNKTKSTVRQTVQKDELQLKIDVILDKISKSGYESLSKEEKEFLFKQR